MSPHTFTLNPLAPAFAPTSGPVTPGSVTPGPVTAFFDDEYIPKSQHNDECDDAYSKWVGRETGDPCERIRTYEPYFIGQALEGTPTYVYGAAAQPAAQGPMPAHIEEAILTVLASCNIRRFVTVTGGAAVKAQAPQTPGTKSVKDIDAIVNPDLLATLFGPGTRTHFLTTIRLLEVIAQYAAYEVAAAVATTVGASFVKVKANARVKNRMYSKRVAIGELLSVSYMSGLRRNAVLQLDGVEASVRPVMVSLIAAVEAIEARVPGLPSFPPHRDDAPTVTLNITGLNIFQRLQYSVKVHGAGWEAKYFDLTMPIVARPTKAGTDTPADSKWNTRVVDIGGNRKLTVLDSVLVAREYGKFLDGEYAHAKDPALLRARQEALRDAVFPCIEKARLFR